MPKTIINSALSGFLNRIISLPVSKNRLSILIFHRVRPEPDPLRQSEIDSAAFEDYCRLLARYFNVLPLTEATRLLVQNRLPRMATSITFDDGYADNATQALPVLKKYNLTATFFIATGFLDGGCMWNDAIIETLRLTKEKRLDLKKLGLDEYSLESTQNKRLAIAQIIDRLKYLEPNERTIKVQRLVEICDSRLPDNLMMTSDQICQMRQAGMEIGAHTVNHPILASTKYELAQQEIADGKDYLEDLLNEKIKIFAYPNGKPNKDYHAENVRMVRSLGFDAAVSTTWGTATSYSDIFQLPRFTPWDRQNLKFYLRLIKNRFKTNYDCI